MGPFYFIPQLSGNDCALDVAYYEGEAEGDTAGSLRWSRSLDLGVTWEPSSALHAPITLTGTRSSPEWLGDYIGLARSENSVFVSYADNAVGATSHTAFARVDSE